MIKLLVYSAYYEPEFAASLYLSTNLYEDFAKNGWQVELFVPMPTRGITNEERNFYKKHKIEKKIENRLTIHRISLMREGKSIFGRAFRYFIMNIAFIWKSLFIRADAIFVQSTPPTQGAMAAIIAGIKHIPMIYNLQDVFPDSLVTADITKKNSFLYKIGRIIENFSYRKADKIITISNNIKSNIQEKNVSDRKIEVIPNWVEIDKVTPIEKEQNPFFEKLGLSRDYFYVVYAGNLGQLQNIEIMIEAARLLKDNKKIRFLIFGKGSMEEKLKTMVQKLDLPNLSFFPIQPYSKVSYVYGLGDVCIVSCKPGTGGSALPSKTWSIMAAGKPIIASFDSFTDMQKMIVQKQVGIFCEAGNVTQFIQAILFYFDNPDMAKDSGKKARIFIEQNLTRDIGTNQYIRVIENAINK